MAYQIIDKQYSNELKKLETQVITQHEQIRAEAKRAKAELAKARPRAVQIPQTPGTTIAAPSTARSSQKAREEIERWEREQTQALTHSHLSAIAELKKAKKHAEIETKEAERKAKVEAEKFVPGDVVKLTTGEFVDKTEFNKLPAKEQDILRAVGMKEYNKMQETAIEHEKAKYVYLPATKEYVDKTEFQKLSLKYQTQLKARGVEGFNKYMEAVAHGEWAEAMRGEQVKLEKFQAENIEVSPGNWVVKKEWKNLTSSQQAEVRKTGSYTTTSALSAKEQFEQGLKEGTIPEGSTFVGTTDGKFEYNLPSLSAKKQFDQALQQGSIPQGSTFIGSTSEGGFEYQQPVLSPRKQFDQALRDGTIPANATYIGEKDKGFEYTASVSARKQFDQCLKTGEIPVDSVYEGEGDKGGFKYTSPSTQEIEYEYYSYGTLMGKKNMLKSEWDKLSDIGKTEKVLGRPPTTPEWVGHRLAEAGVEVPWWYQGVSSDFFGWLSRFTPGTQQTEVIFNIKDKAWKEWEDEYGKAKAGAEFSQKVIEQPFPILRAMRPHVTIQDITWQEHLMTAVNLALLTSPKWLPGIVRAVKKKFPRLRIGTKPFSEPGRARVEMQQAKLPTQQPVFRPTKVAGPGELGAPTSQAEFNAFIRARVNAFGLSPEVWKAMQAAGAKLLKPSARVSAWKPKLTSLDPGAFKPAPIKFPKIPSGPLPKDISLLLELG